MASVWGELKRRNVVKVGVAYGIVAWALVEIVATIEGPLGLPDWVDTLVIVLLAVGFPIALILSWAYDMTPQGIRSASATRPTEGIAQPTEQRFNYVIVGLIALTLAFLVFDRFVLAPQATITSTGRPVAPGSARGTDAGPSTTVQRFSLDIGPATSAGFASDLTAQLALSPDGTRLAYATLMRGDNLDRIYLRPLAQLDARPIAGAEESDQPFFSPDGERLAFFSGNLGLAVVSVRGGAPRSVIGEAYFNNVNPSGGVWLADDTIIFSAGGPSNTGRSLFRVAVSGGSPEPLLPATDQEGYRLPSALPGGEAILLTIRVRSRESGSASNTSIAALSLGTGDLRRLIGPGYMPRYVPSGHIVFIRDGALWAVPFDADRLEVTGAAVEVVGGVQHDSLFGGREAAYATSDNGLLVYAPGGDVGTIAGRRLKRLAWVDQQGNEQPLAGAEPRDYRNPRISPDGQRLAVTIEHPDDEGIWIYDMARETLGRLTRAQGADNRPLWTPDGERVVFRSGAPGGRVHWAAAEGTGAVTPLSTWGTQQDFTPDGTGLVITGTGEFRNQLRLLSMDGSGVSELLLESWSEDYIESLIELSPNGRWMAYTSEFTGGEEVYVRPFPPVEDRTWRISTNGGFEPRWAADGGTLFYRSGNAMMSVSVETDETGSAFSPGLPEELFSGPYAGVNAEEHSVARPSYDVSPDGRFLMLKYADPAEQENGSTQLVVVDNWFEELNRLAPRSE